MSIWGRLGIRKGSVVLNLGCGKPEDSVALSEVVDARGIVYGIERDEALIRDVYECFGVDNVSVALAEVKRVLRDNGGC